MSNKEKQVIAQKIVDKQLETMKKYHAASSLTPRKYKNLVAKVADSVRT